MSVRVRSIELEGFKSIRQMKMELGALNVLIGPNGAGKSNFLSFFDFYRSAMVRELQLYVGRDGADSILHFGSKETSTLSSRVEFELGYSYFMQLDITKQDTLFFTKELMLNDKTGSEYDLGSGHRESNIFAWEIDMHDKDPNTIELVHYIGSNFLVYQFHDTTSKAKIRLKGYVGDNIRLHRDAGNLAAVLHRLKTSSPEHYKRILSTVQLIAPYFGDFVLVPEHDNIMLRWREKGSEMVFGPHQLSDGTLRAIALVTLLLQPNVPPLLIIDEPELGLHPYGIHILAGLIKGAAKTSQVIVSTQSVTLMNQFEIDDLIVVERHDGQSTFERKNKEDFTDWLEDYTVGQLWEMNVLGGRPSQ